MNRVRHALLPIIALLLLLPFISVAKDPIRTEENTKKQGHF